MAFAAKISWAYAAGPEVFAHSAEFFASHWADFFACSG